jgi:hypothetical protein
MSSEPDLSRRTVIRELALVAAVAVVAPQAMLAQTKPGNTAVVYKDPSCGCCSKWIDHLKAAGYAVTVHDTADMTEVKRAMGVPSALESCHTARIGRLTVEGHVPADLITKLLAEPATARGFTARGLAVPGMPMGSPGMEGARKDAYDVLLFDASGKTRVYASR